MIPTFYSCKANVEFTIVCFDGIDVIGRFRSMPSIVWVYRCYCLKEIFKGRWKKIFHLAVPFCLHGCQHSCNNLNGSFFCSCNAGYVLSKDNRTCSGVIFLLLPWIYAQRLTAKNFRKPNLSVLLILFLIHFYSCHGQLFSLATEFLSMFSRQSFGHINFWIRKLLF